MQVKDADYYENLYVLNSFEMNIGGDIYAVKIWADDVEIYKNGELLLEDNPINLYKEGEVIQKLNQLILADGMKIIRKITEDEKIWYTQLVLQKNEKGECMLHRSYFQDDGETKPDWSESNIIDMPMENAVELFTVLMAEISSADLDL